MARDYPGLSSDNQGYPVKPDTEMEAAWVQAQENLPPGCSLEELHSEFYQLLTPWGLHFKFTDDGLILQSPCCNYSLSPNRGYQATCIDCGLETLLPSFLSRRTRWPEAKVWVEELLTHCGQDPLTATLNASVVEYLRALARSPRRLHQDESGLL